MNGGVLIRQISQQVARALLEYGGLWALGNPDWTCRDDGSDSNCDFDPCDNRVLNDKGDEIREAYYVLESITRLHSYFTGLSEAFEVSAIFAALSKDSWATTFYKDKDVKSVNILKEILNAVGAVIGIGSAFAGLAGAGRRRCWRRPECVVYWCCRRCNALDWPTVSLTLMSIRNPSVRGRSVAPQFPSINF